MKSDEISAVTKPKKKLKKKKTEVLIGEDMNDLSDRVAVKKMVQEPQAPRHNLPGVEGHHEWMERLSDADLAKMRNWS